MLNTLDKLEVLHCEVQEIQLQAGLDDNDFMSLYKLIEDLREDFSNETTNT